MGFQKLNRVVLFDLGLMFFGSVMFLVSLLGMLALLLLMHIGIVEAEGLHWLPGAVLIGMLSISIWNLKASISLINQPLLGTAQWIVARSILACSPLLVLLLK
ncbi:hypothetical protein M2336_001830 [Sphingobium sp. B1D7B]|uniref:hypothetical protein n=1 Tax=unclassified Sphingobium TaxID=2611147 RepID=UPI0022242612|nr:MULTISPECIES: hypothetical protein [unclassified Sphingobium]MCW2393317.1 hypothetical protein [Sphingobium sp. B11D3A]MCW2405201.1 hypothetical protein [Sphingobium sp. B1D7B]